MAISDSQKVDLLYKKIAWSVSKTDTQAAREAYNEAVPSPLLIRGDSLWQLSGSIPASIPSVSSDIVQIYKDGGGAYSPTVECTEVVATDNRTWSTGLTDWIDPQFGSTYFVKVYVSTTGNTTPQTSGTSLQAAGLNDDQWYFDYQAGILNFIGTNVPTAISVALFGTADVPGTGRIFISGARYIGPKGATNFSNGLTIGNLSIAGNNISSSSGNVTIAANLFVTGNTTLAGYSDITIQDSIINLHTQANLAPWTTNDGKDIGLKFHYYDTVDSHAFIGRANDSGYLEWYSKGVEISGNVFQGTSYGVFKTGEVIIANTTPATTSNTGALTVWGGAGIVGNLFSGNVSTSQITNTKSITSGNVIAGNVISRFYGNVSADLITPYNTNVTIFNSNTAVKLPVGTTAQRPDGANGFIRYNTDIPALEYYDGTIWVPVTNTVTDQQIIPNGTDSTFTLDQESSAIGMIVSINGTLQQPTTAYTVTGNQITFVETPLTTDNIDIRFLGASVTINTSLADDLVIAGNLTVSGNIFNSGSIYSYGNTEVGQYLTHLSGNIIPNANVTYSLGSSTNQWKDLWVSNNTIYVGNTPITVSNGTLLVNNSPITGGTTYSNTNVAAYLTTDATVTTLQANLGVTQTWANANIASINTNIGGFYSWANTNFGTSSYSNTNANALLSSNTISTISTTGNVSVGGNLTVTGNLVQQTSYYETYGNVSNTGGNLTCNFNLGTTFYAALTANVTANFTNVNAVSSTVTGATIIVDQGATAYRVANVQVNGVNQTVKWVGATTGTGTASNTDVMSFSLIHLGSGTYRVLGQISNYA